MRRLGAFHRRHIAGLHHLAGGFLRRGNIGIARRDIIGRGEARNIHRDEIRIAQMGGAVGIDATLQLGHQVNMRRRIMPQRGDVKSLRPFEKLRQRNPATAWRRHGDNLMPAIIKAHRRAPDGRIGGEVLMRNQPAAADHFIDQQIGHPPLVKSGAALLRNRLKRARQSGKFYALALSPAALFQHRRGEAVLRREISLKAIELTRRLLGQDEALGGQRDRRANERVPRLRAKPLVQRRHAGHTARHANRQMPFQAQAFYHLALVIEIHIARSGKGGALSEIQRAGGAIGQPIDHKAAAADISGLLIHHGQREIDRHRRVKRIAALRQHIAAHLAGQPMRRDNHCLRAIHPRGREPPMMAEIEILQMQKRRGEHQRDHRQHRQHRRLGRLIGRLIGGLVGG